MSVRHALLALLTEGPKYGLQLRHQFEQQTGEVWPLNVGQVYTTLQRLERDGLIESDGDDEAGPQKSFRITTAGATELSNSLRTPPDLNSPPRDELVIKGLGAIRVPGAGRLSCDGAGCGAVSAGFGCALAGRGRQPVASLRCGGGAGS